MRVCRGYVGRLVGVGAFEKMAVYVSILHCFLLHRSRVHLTATLIQCHLGMLVYV